MSRDLLNKPLQDVLEFFGIAEWDVLMIGDGSGCSWDIGMGWATAIIDRGQDARKLIGGGWTTGSVAIAELMAYVHGIAWYDNVVAAATRKQRSRGVLNIHIISDSKLIVDQGNNVAPRGKLLPWWGAWAGYLRNGYTAKFHWVPGHDEGAQVGLNVLCDHVSRSLRILTQDTPRDAEAQASKSADQVPISVYDVNP